MVALPAKRSGVQPAGERPDALSPCSSVPSHRMQKPSDPMPLPVGSTTVSVIAAASAASSALPPLRSMFSPASVAKGCDVATALRAMTGERREGYFGVN